MSNVLSLSPAPFRSCIPIDPQTPRDGQGRTEHRSSKLLSWLAWSMYCTCVSLRTVSHSCSTYTHVFWSFLPVMYWFSVCLPVPRWNHQKHQRGGGDGNLWPLVLSAGCHRLGYEGSRDSHRISERGKRVMHHLSNSLNLINPSHSVMCKKSWKYVHRFVSSSFFTGRFLFFWANQLVVCPHLLFHHHLIVLFFVLLLHAVCFAEQITPSCWKPLYTLISWQNALHDVQAAHWFSFVCLVAQLELDKIECAIHDFMLFMFQIIFILYSYQLILISLSYI